MTVAGFSAEIPNDRPSSTKPGPCRYTNPFDVLALQMFVMPSFCSLHLLFSNTKNKTSLQTDGIVGTIPVHGY
jgi:hypothetical protein